ncbi:histone deacetylase 8 [Trametes versicolor FP-101664 SS1]|uniref:histone deacetylase 8 n=1 Tax=Trametes versicolor (strain FP-101664) TaxID=717944 RepID=UPI000462454D|nr:histone deacetylase 8 [Trametes versicolor FP-101664 SS1]EIW55921.1 histone deacetylase 8 [Trametes versicolor FP-101664 SS1]
MSSRRVCYIVSNDLVKASSLLPSNKNRSLLVHTLAKAYGLLSPREPEGSGSATLTVLRPIPADTKELSAYHDRDYLEFVLKSNQAPSEEDMNAEFGIEEDCPAFPHLPEYVRLVGGATLIAAKALRNNQAEVAICWDGGRHHAQKSRASGFCYVADCVLAILTLKRPIPATPSPLKPRVMYLDLDLHFSDGVSQAFHSISSASSSPQVLTFSVHHTAPGFFPVSEHSVLSDPTSPSFDPFALSLPLERGASNATFARVWNIIDRVKDAFRPDYVVVQCGVDGLAGDPYATWNWSLGDGDGSLGWYIDNICRWGCKTLLLGGGGYNSPNVARAWTYFTSIALDRPLSLEADIPDHSAFPLYAPSFILDVPPGNTQDQNTAEYLQHAESVFAQITETIRERVGTSEQRA